MDPIIQQSMAKWPNVPALYGWLSLDRRGNWLIKGERIGNPALTAFIGRNYHIDGQGRWFFQNGPQRVFVTLDYTPLVYRLVRIAPDLALETHTGGAVTCPRSAWIDESCSLLLLTEHGVGVMLDRDLLQVLPFFNVKIGDEEALAEALQALCKGDVPAEPLKLSIAGRDLSLEPIRSEHVPARFGFIPDPRPAPATRP